jgi:hypothetical protein
LEESGASEPVSAALDVAVFAGAVRGGLSSVVFVSTGAAATALVNARPVAAVAAVVTLCVAGCCTGPAAASVAAA